MLAQNQLPSSSVASGLLPALATAVVAPTHWPQWVIKQLHERVLPWETLTAVIEGQSVIDLSTMPVQSAPQALAFVQAYGYNLKDATDAQEVKLLTERAMLFIEQQLLRFHRSDEAALSSHQRQQLERLSIPTGLKQRADAVELLLLASQVQKTPISLWACAVLKVLHTLVHIENSPKLQFVNLAREQVLSKIQGLLSVSNDSNVILLGQPNSQKQLPLVAVDIKEMKSLDSLLIKLLSKKTNMMDEVDDLIGFRLVTETPADVLLALDILQESQLLVFTNINANRSRNSLIRLEDFQQVWEASSHPNANPNASSATETSVASNFSGIQTWEALQSALTSLGHTPLSPEESSFSSHNPHSHETYRSLHITCRHLLRLRRPSSSRDERIFFPYEIQFLDKESYNHNQQGDRAHTQYKHRQLMRARRRVLGSLLAPESQSAD
jgi:uncharacterized protein (TIGR04552 family)